MPFGLTGFKLIAILVAVAAIVGSLIYLRQKIYNDGYAAGYAKLTQYIEEQGQATRETEREVEKIVKEVEIKYVDRIKLVKVKGDTITKTVTEYVTTPDDTACTLRNGWVRVHDAAAGNRPAEPAAESDRSPAGIALSEATAVIADNYKTCYVWREQVLGWQEFWAQYTNAIKSAVCVPR